MRRELAIAGLMLNLLVRSLSAQAPIPTNTGAAQPAPALAAQDLDRLVAPIALYPDALVSHVLPASTTPIDVVQAARYLRQHNGKIDNTPDNNWNISVQVLMQFPDVLYKMDTELDWTTALGKAVTAQLEDVMKAIQRVRSVAHAAGNLESNDKQVVVVESEVIRVVPSTSVIYVPTYEPTRVVVVQEKKTNTAATAAVSFAAGVAVGAALADDNCDWHGHGIYHGSYYGAAGWNAHWHSGAQLPWNPRGVADPRGAFDPRGRYDPRGGYGAGGVGRAGVGGQAGVGGGLAGQAGIGRGAAGVGRPGAAGQAGVGGGAAGQAGVGGGAAGVGRPGAGGQAGAGGGEAGQAEAGRGTSGAGASRSAFAGQQGDASRTQAASARGNRSLSGGGGRGGRR